MNLNLIKLLPIAIGVGAIGAGSMSGIGNTINHCHSQKTTDPFVVWATAAQKAAVAKNIPQFVKIAKISDWKTTDAIVIESVKIDIWNVKVDIVLAQPALNLSATISDVWIGDAYNINQWWCSVAPRETVANWWWQNWYAGWNSFNHTDAKQQLYDIAKYWSNHKLTHGYNSDAVYNQIFSDGPSALWWNVNIQNVVIKNHNVTFTIHFFPSSSGHYFSINAQAVYDSTYHHSFWSDQIRPLQSTWSWQ